MYSAYEIVSNSPDAQLKDVPKEEQKSESKSSSASYSVELTKQEKLNVQIIQDACDDQVFMASLRSEGIASIIEEKCRKSVNSKVQSYKGPKVIALAIENHDVNACNLLNVIERCVLAYVEEFKELDACNLLDSKDNCVTTLAIYFKDSAACNRLDDKTSCITSYASKLKDPNYCLQLSDPQSCLDTMVKKMGAPVCKLMSAEKVVDCKKNYLASPSYKEGSNFSECTKSVKSVTVTTGCNLKTRNLDGITAKEVLSWWSSGELPCNLKLPQSLIDGGFEKDYCIAAYAIALNDLSLCDSAGVVRGPCYHALAWIYDSISLKTCERLDQEVTIFTCYGSVAGRTLDRSICEKVCESCPNFQNNCNAQVDWGFSWEKSKK